MAEPDDWALARAVYIHCVLYLMLLYLMLASSY